MADDARIGADATLLPEATPVVADAPTAASVVARRGPSASAITRVARYVLLEHLGEGGMGVVWSAYDPELDRRIAVKLIRGEADDAARQRFIREARAMAQLHHPAIVAIHDVGTTGEHAYIAMELVRGVTLRDWLKDSTRSWRAAASRRRSARTQPRSPVRSRASPKSRTRATTRPVQSSSMSA